MASEDELRQLVANDAGNPAFAELAEAIRKRGAQSEALDICLAGLAKNPTCHIGRLVLSRVFYERGMTAFAVRELEALREALPESKTVLRLLDKLAPGTSQGVPSAQLKPTDTVAETEFDFEELDLIGQEKK
jgi:predicted Zn-dependent protease